MVHAFDIENMKLDLMKKSHFREFLAFKMQRGGKLRFSDFNKMTGISRQQWDVFRIDNKDNKNIKDIEWVMG
jgi:hypothetical protein